MLGAEKLIQVGFSLSADGVQPELHRECTKAPRPLSPFILDEHGLRASEAGLARLRPGIVDPNVSLKCRSHNFPQNLSQTVLGQRLLRICPS